MSSNDSDDDSSNSRGGGDHGQGIVVCLKWVATRPEIDPLTASVSADDRFSGISPADSAALEWSLRVAENRSTTVTAVTVGPDAAMAALRHALGHGATTAVHIHSDLAELPSRTVADALATVCAGADMVVCGDHSLDRGSGSVPAFIASRLGSGQALGCVGLELDSARTVAERRLDQGRRERLELVGPTVVSFEGGLELRRAGLSATIAATEASIAKHALDDLDLPGPGSSAGPEPTVTETKPYRPRPRVLPPPVGSTLERVRQLTGVGEEPPASQLLELPPTEAAKAVVDQLQAWGYLDNASSGTASSDSDTAASDNAASDNAPSKTAASKTAASKTVSDGSSD